MHSNTAFWLAERAPASFSYSAKTTDFALPLFHFKMDDIMNKTHQDKIALKYLIVDGFGHVNMQIDSVFLANLLIYIYFLFRRIVKKL